MISERRKYTEEFKRAVAVPTTSLQHPELPEHLHGMEIVLL